MDQRNLQGIDAAWIAVDVAGRLALFTTGGAGPVPEAAMPTTGFAEDLVLALPEISEVDLPATTHCPDCFIAFAKRGVFAYDWSDVHRSSPQTLGGYELQAGPCQPLLLTDLSLPLHAIAAATTLCGVSFGASVVFPTKWRGV